MCINKDSIFKENSTAWGRCPKHKHHGSEVVWCAMALAVCHFYSGAFCRLKIMERPSIPGGACTRQAAHYTPCASGEPVEILHVIVRKQNEKINL